MAGGADAEGGAWVPPVESVRVIELASGIAGPYAGKLFVDAGADVVKVEPAEGDPLRHWRASGGPGGPGVKGGPGGQGGLGGADGALFRFLNAAKRSVVGAPGDEAVDDLVADADVVIEDAPPGVLEASGWLAQPGLVVLSITPWGRGGPLSGRPATEFTVQAECGSLAGRGRHDGPPVQAGGRLAEWAAGTYGAPAALAAVVEARRSGRAVHVDVSMAEAMCQCTNLYADLMHRLAGRPPLVAPARFVELPSIEPTADGWVGFNTNAAQMFQDFLVLIGHPELIGDERFATFPARMANLDAWSELVHAYTRAHTTDEVVEAASLLRVPAVPVCDGRSVVAVEHFVARGVFEDHPEGFVAPVPPYRIAGERPRPARARRAPALGEHDGKIEGRRRVTGAKAERAGIAAASVEPGRPYAGLRILDLTCWWAGPAATQFFSALGAEAVHLEAIQRVDGMRLAAALNFLDRERWWEYSSFFLSINPNKRDVTLDLGRPDGRRLVERLVEWADLVVENYTPRVLESFGLGWDEVHRLNPSAVMVRMPAFGLDGPWRDRQGFAQNMEQLSGLAWVTGFPDGAPMIPRGPCDPIGGMHAAFAIQVALARQVAAGGEGMLVEAPLVDSALNVAAEQVIEHSASGEVLGRTGNRSTGVAPQGIYRGANGEWVAVSVATDEQWQAIVSAMGSPAWATDSSLGAHPGRWAAHDALDDHLAAWVARAPAAAVAADLVAAGVPASPLTDPRLVSDHPQFAARGFFETLDHPVVGSHPTMGLPFRWSGVDRWFRTAAPALGADNDAVLGGLLGLDAGELAALRSRGVVGERPAGV